MNRSIRTRVTAPIAIALALVLAPALSGCMGNPIENIIEGATGGDVELPGTSLPEGFPTEVPLIEGEVAFGVAIGNGYNVSVRVDGPEAIDEISDQLEAAGFTAQAGGTTGAETTQAFSSDAFTVIVVLTKEGDTGYLANYTVAPTG